MPKLSPPVNQSDHFLGLPGAPIELVEYGDFQCPHCGAAHPILNELKHTFGESLTLIFRHFPLSSIHPFALAAAIAAEAAARQHQFWGMHDIIFENQRRLSPQAILEFGKVLGLNIATFQADMQDAIIAEKVESDFESGVRSGVNGTPSFFINGVKYNGMYDYESMAEALGAIVGKTH